MTIQSANLNLLQGAIISLTAMSGESPYLCGFTSNPDGCSLSINWSEDSSATVVHFTLHEDEKVTMTHEGDLSHTFADVYSCIAYMFGTLSSSNHTVNSCVNILNEEV